MNKQNKNERLTTISLEKYANNTFDFNICFDYRQTNLVNSTLSIQNNTIKLFLSGETPRKIYSNREIFYKYKHILKNDNNSI